jgi:DNA-binding protein YbaB
MKKRAKDVQQELALDMKLLEQMLTATTNEAMQSLQKKVTRSTSHSNSYWIPAL